MSDIALSGLRATANGMTLGYVEKWLGTNGMRATSMVTNHMRAAMWWDYSGTPLEHQAVECDVVCLECGTFGPFTFEFLGGIGKLDRPGGYTNKYSGNYRQRVIKNTTIYLSDIYEVRFLSLLAVGHCSYFVPL